MRIQQILINFLSNAVKFSPKFESITVTVNAVRVSEGKVQVRLDVKDNGIGICEEEQARLFSPYFRTQNTMSRALNSSSNGLGLYICQKIACGLNGNITCKSSLGAGSIFTFSFIAEINNQVPISVKAIKNKQRKSLHDKFNMYKNHSKSILNKKVRPIVEADEYFEDTV